MCVESRLVYTYPAECVLGFACQPHSANPVWRLVIFSSCGVGLWYIKEHRGLAPSGSLAVWFDATALSLGDPLGRVSSKPPPPSRPPSWDRVGQMPGALGHTKRLLTWPGEALYRLLSFCSQRAIFHPSLLLLISSFFKSERCVCFTASVSPQCSSFLCASPSDSDTEVMVFKDGLGSEFKDPHQASYLLLPDGLFIPHFLAHEVCSLYGHFLHSLCHTHRSNLLIGAIKR